MSDSAISKTTSPGAASAVLGPRGSSVSGTGQETSPGLMKIFFLVICIPVMFSIGGVVLSPTRLLLLAIILPALSQLFSGQLGKINIVDKFVLAFCGWMVIALAAVHGAERLAFAVITSVEILGGYMVGRMLVRNAADFRRMFSIHMLTLIVLAPFAVIETITGRLVIPSLLGKLPLIDTFYRGSSAYGRMGLERVYGVFDHPILFGLYCSVALANLFMIYPSAFQRVKNCAFVTAMTFMSLSSAPLLSIGLQVGLLSWNWVMKGRWKLFLILAAIAYVVVDALSNRTPITILIETMTFHSASGWFRIAIFESGFAAVKNNPIFGIGFNDWPRPFWLTSSVDNFWLLTAMRYGAVGFLLLAISFTMQIICVGRAKAKNADIERYKVGYCIVIAAISFCLVTVHMWGTVSVFVMFYIGAGAWFYCGNDPDETDGAAIPAQTAPVRTSRYTRFAGQTPGGHDPGAETVSAQTPPAPTSRYTRFAGQTPARGRDPADGASGRRPRR